jgi:hypothetical protein
MIHDSLPEWERKTAEEANGGKLAESLGWASKDHGFGYGNCIPLVRTLG